MYQGYDIQKNRKANCIRYSRYQYFRSVLLYCKLWREHLLRFRGNSFFEKFRGNSFFSSKGGRNVQKGGRGPPFIGKRGLLPFFCQIFDTENTDRVFLRYRFGKYREIPTDTDRKIPIRDTTLEIGAKSRKSPQFCPSSLPCRN
jgi:hypothetical protein